MELPAITIPQITLPFELPTLLHPAVVHFAIVIPVIILLMEFYNLFTKRRSISAFTFILLLVTVAMLAMAYLTGGVDGKEAYDMLSSDGQSELKAHKLLGAYVLFTAVAVIIFKILSMTGKGFFRFLYFMMLIGLIAITLKQGKEGGELVYAHGANVETVVSLKDELLDAKEEIEELNEETTKIKPVKVETIDVVEKIVPIEPKPMVEKTLIKEHNVSEVIIEVQDTINEVNETR